MQVLDDRRPPFIWATCSALGVIRQGVAANEKSPRLPAVLATYVALLEIANEARARLVVGGDSEGFEAVNARLAGLAGASVGTVIDAVRALEALGLVRVERRRNAAGGRNLPNRYELKDPASQDVLSAPCPANQDVPGAPCPANQDVLSAPSSKKRRTSRRTGGSSNSGKADEAWDRFLASDPPGAPLLARDEK